MSYLVNPYMVTSALEPTYETDFSSDTGWLKTGTNIEISSGALNYDAVPNNSSQSISHTLDSSASDTAFVMRYTDSISAFATLSGQEEFIFMGLSDANHATSGGSTQDFLYMFYQLDASKDNIGVSDVDGGNPSANSQVPSNNDYFTTAITVTEFKPEHTRLSSTSFQVKLDYTSTVETVTRTIPSSVISLDNIKCQNRSDGASAQSSMISGNITNLKFYDNVTSV